jgi:hypothetical protein
MIKCEGFFILIKSIVLKKQFWAIINKNKYCRITEQGLQIAMLKVKLQAAIKLIKVNFSSLYFV